MSQALAMFKSIGPEQFSQFACNIAPYFHTIAPQLISLEPCRAEAKVTFRHEITNHLGTIHAIALCNIAEFVGGLMTDVSVPDQARWIPKGMTVEYLAKAKTDIHAIADGHQIDWSTPGDKIVGIDVFDTAGTKVFTARITMNVKFA